MNLELVAAVLRPRRGFEATDLGLALARRWAAPIAAAWSIAVLPICALFLFFDGLPFYAAVLMLWWLKPLFERVPLFVLSRALFGAVPTLQTTLRALPSLYGRNIALALFSHRLHPARGLLQPVALLEGLRGSARASRERVLVGSERGIATMLSVMHFFIEWMLTLQLLALVYFFTPQELCPDLTPLWRGEFERFEPGWLSIALRLCWLASYSLVGPLNAATGFALYLNRRMQIEGWDIELVFRRLAARASGLAKVVALVIFGCFVCGRARAQTAEEVAPPAIEVSTQDETTDAKVSGELDPKVVVDEVLAHEDFRTKRTSRELGWNLPSGRGVNSSLFGLLAQVFVFFGWALLIVLLVGLVIALARAIGWIDWKGKGAAAVAAPPPTHLFGLDLRPQSLPDDIGQAAAKLWRAGDAVGAMGLLYRAAISRLIEFDALELVKSDTESDCLRRAQKLVDSARIEYFAGVTRAWLTCAYSPRKPSDDVAEALCAGWNERFERRSV